MSGALGGSTEKNQFFQICGDRCCDHKDQPDAPLPADPCGNVSCFCSPFVMHDTGSVGDVLILLMAAPYLPSTCCISDDSLHSAFQVLLAHQAFPGDITERASVLPLLI